ncbi:D-alanyl-D-alanine carboxypeptidase/D-alanyl-D-alanine-endopeptidase [Massilia sp. BSC265]|uniref:D-alanyl-D-alanine carboxypeptidase/D-alanyl-D-alanine endopeptidase n=1 Tax=Massilia sp. BSC265 TaxID=1549812 RepID=UPI00068F506D|nr:D-alanyl-D-alanine carboxypeptidase/D-alanyl-D-alanine-endopeptidase [Massilia sp. BSC265]
MPIFLHRIIRTASAVCAVIVLAAHAGATPPAAVLQELARQGLPVDALSYQIAPLAGVPAPHALDAHRVTNPASAMKLVTTLAALDTLGPAHRWTTAMLSDARLENGELKGDLYLLGGGDPNLSWERVGSMLRSLRNSGIVSIAGDLVLDRTLFQPTRLDIGRPPFDDTPDASYNVIPDALAVSDNLVAYTLSSDGAKVAVQVTPPLSGVSVLNRMTLNELPCRDWQETWQRPKVEEDEGGAVRIVLGGSFPRDCSKTVELNTIDRDLYLERLVRALWEEMGGQWRGRAREGKVPARATVLAERQSETLAETIRDINKDSHAVKARMLYLTMGAMAGEGARQPTLERARRRVIDWVAAQGVDPAGMVIENGSGLSRIERLSAAQLAALLKSAAASRWYPEFAASLPIVALDGTMRNRLKLSPAAGNARMKTGTLRDVAALAGYVRDRRGQDWIVTAFVNDPQADEGRGRAVLDQLILWVAEGKVTAPETPTIHPTY